MSSVTSNKIFSNPQGFQAHLPLTFLKSLQKLDDALLIYGCLKYLFVLMTNFMNIISDYARTKLRRASILKPNSLVLLS